MTALVYQAELWLIVGLLFILLELTDWSAIFWLPMGLAASFLALWVFLFNESVIPSSWLPSTWYMVFLIWGVLALICALALAYGKRVFFPKKASDTDDINQY